MTLAEIRFVLPDFRLAGAEIFLLFMICVILIVELFVAKKGSETARKTAHALAQLALAGSAALICTANASGVALRTFSNTFVSDPIADVLKLAIILAVSLSFLYSSAKLPGRAALAKAEFYALTLVATLGMMVIVSAGSFMTLYLGVELLSLPVYALVALDRDSASATEAGMKYFVLGALASGLLLYGISMIYGATGSLDAVTVAGRLFSPRGNRIVAAFGVVFLVAGIAFKLGAAPFHMWVPDVYQGAPTPVTLLVASAPKIALFGFAVRALPGALAALSQDWQAMLLVISATSIAVGNVAAIAQTNVKRMLAYSSIAHTGFVLLGLSVGVVDGSAANMINAYSASLFYVLVYALSSLGAFGILLLLPGSEGEGDISALAGLGARNPLLAAALATLMFSMAGIPFLAGFFAKFSVLVAVVAAGSVWLAVFAVFFSLVGVFYYLRVVRYLYFDSAAPFGHAANIEAPAFLKALAAANALAVALLGVFPNALMAVCVYALSRSIFM
ncbi:MAG: NADH-quinone oxidoreductase subunit NuoN [Candidatus Accumulibacter sp.]|jgi:NADH-quinone oxidoreductase subunit N|nr:NADH-quinone oxidoreductase subunit NuoN [Accumulibacter sp.]